MKNYTSPEMQKIEFVTEVVTSMTTGSGSEFIDPDDE